MLLLQGEELQSSCWLKLHCKQTLTHSFILSLIFRSSPDWVAHGASWRPAKVLGHGPGLVSNVFGWFVGAHAKNIWKLLFFSQYTVWHLQGFSSCPLLWLPTVTLLRLLNSVSVLHSHQRWHSFLVQPATSLLFKNNSACSCFPYPKLSVEKARPLSFGPFCRLCLVNIHTNNLPSALWCDGQTMFHAPCDQNRFTFITFTGTQWS